MSDFSDHLTYRWTNFNFYSVEDDLRGIFEAVLEGYEEMKRKARFKGEPEELLRFYCRQSMEEMRTIYQKNLPKQTNRVDYTNRVTQWSYMYLYMLRHVHLAYCALRKGIEENILRVKPNDAPVDVCMIGGGPGSDILGICLLMKEYRCRTPWTNQVFVLDACAKWEYSWNKMYNLLPEKFRQGVPEVKYCPFNYRDNDLSTRNQQIIKNADMITMIKSLSAAGAWLKNRERVYEKYRSPGGRRKKKLIEWHSVYSILKHMQPGAILLFLDNKKGWQREILMEAATYLKFDVLLDTDLQEVRMPTSFLASNREFSEKIEWKPCSTAGNNEMIILRKPGYLSHEVKLEVTVPNQSLLKTKRLSQSRDANTVGGVNGVRNVARQNVRTPSQTSATSTRGAKIVEGIDGVRVIAPHNFRPSSQTPFTATRGANTVEGVDGVRNLARQNLRPANTSTTAMQGANRVQNLHRYSSRRPPQTPVTSKRRANSTEGVDGAARGYVRRNSRMPPRTSATATKWDRFVRLFCCCCLKRGNLQEY